MRYERFQAALAEAGEIKKKNPKVETIARNLTQSYPHEFGAQHLIVDLVLARLGRERIEQQMASGQWMIGNTVIREYFQVRKEMGKGSQRIGIKTDEVVLAVMTGKVTLPIPKQR